MPIEVLQVAFGSREYEEAVRLREAVLRAPLGLKLEPRDVERDHEDVHLVACEEEIIVGGAILRTAGDAMRMRQVAVAETHRGRGVGKMLVVATEELARARNAREINLHARETAVEFYRSLGYRTRGEFFLEVGLRHVEMYKALST